MNRRPKAMIIIVFIVLILELTLWNRPYYSHFWQDAESNEFALQNVFEQDGVFIYDNSLENPEGISPAIVFQDLNRRVNSIYIKPYILKDDSGNKMIPSMSFSVVYGDENNTYNSSQLFTVIPGVEHTYYHEINPYGDVSYLAIMPHADAPMIALDFAVNKTIPFQFNIFRVLMMILLVLGVYALVTTDIRKIVFNPNAQTQNGIMVFMLICFGLLSLWISFNSSVNHGTEPFQHLVDSFLEGRLDLGIEPSPALKSMENPYDYTKRVDLGLHELSETYDTALKQVTLFWDSSYYNEKFFVYFGIVPVILFFLPYHLYTGAYLPILVPTVASVFLAGLFFILLWREIVKRHFKDMPFVMYLCMSATLYFVTMNTVNLYQLQRWNMACCTGLMFVALGLYLVFIATNKEFTKLSIPKLMFGCLSLALSVGCRPSYIFASVLVPFGLWGYVYKKKIFQIIKTVVCIAIPYVIVAIPLMWYNYARFDSPFEFGTSYMLGAINLSVYNLINPMGGLLLAFKGFLNVFFAMPTFVSGFPFVLNSGTLNIPEAAPVMFYDSWIGIICFPVLWFIAFLPSVWKRLREYSNTLSILCIVMLSLSIFLGIFIQVSISAYSRYMCDYMFMVLLSALVIMFLVWEKYRRNLIFARVICALCIVSILVALPIAEAGAYRASLKPEAIEVIKGLLVPFG